MSDQPTKQDNQPLPEFLAKIAVELDLIGQAILDHGVDTIWLEDTEMAYDAIQRLRADITRRVYIITNHGPKDRLHTP